MRDNIIYKRCPTEKCGITSGFDLPISEIKKDRKYFCHSCQKESKLSKWKDSKFKEFIKSKKGMK